PPLASVSGALFDPRSIAVVGASDNPGKWGYLLAQLALRGAHRRAVYLVNPARATVQSRHAPDLVVLEINPLLATPRGAVALDVRAIPAARKGECDGPAPHPATS